MPVRKPYVVQISDTHLFEDPSTRLWGIAPEHHADEVIDAVIAVAPEPELVLVTGDCSGDGSLASYERLGKKIARFDAPACFLPGNHDDAALMAQHLMNRTLDKEKLCFTYDAAGWRFIMLDSSVRGEDAGCIGDAQREWLRNTLASAPLKPVIIAVHHNPVPVGSQWLDTMTISDGAALLAILDTAPQVKAVLFGHVHQDFEDYRDGTLYASVPSTFFQFKPRSKDFGRDDGRAAGARLVRLGDDKVTSTVLRVGEPVPTI
ncbi:MAG TPA: phosphodiesterase [Candidatus Eremiobacteraceae bacterium]|nr:phosphodiesterase [Candidatus Eremiobacteraceae bacterium]